jgi:hypothetical protein
MRWSRPPKPPLPEGLVREPRTKNAPRDIASPMPAEEIYLTFKELIRGQVHEEDIPEILKQQQQGNDRSVCIIMTAMLERNLEYLITIRIAAGFALNEKWRDHLFMRDGALSSFHSNIRFARLLDLITDETMKDLDIIREIRNHFAHSALPLHFKLKAIRDKLATMRYARYQGVAVEEHLYSLMTKERREFIFSCFMILHELRDMSDRLEEIV